MKGRDRAYKEVIANSEEYCSGPDDEGGDVLITFLFQDCFSDDVYIYMNMDMNPWWPPPDSQLLAGESPAGVRRDPCSSFLGIRRMAGHLDKDNITEGGCRVVMSDYVALQ